ncbi:MAG: bacteriophage abortive infection AbiH family protein [Clostridia bacterium]|nr:bacteriophage abortive infection AbiH family protein [Clostridia bacterium]
MRTVFLLGNGFDINLGLKTRFRDFYDYYLGIESKKDIIIQFKKDLRENLENWSDLEIELGKYSKNFNKKNEQEFIELLYDIQDNLADYLDKQDLDFTISDADKRKTFADLINYERYLTERERRNFSNYLTKTDNHINIITYNYTKTFEKLYDWEGSSKLIGNKAIAGYSYKVSMDSVEHIHGTTSNNMLLGVNDSSQILSEDLKGSLKTLRSFVKTEMNLNAGTLRDEHCVSIIGKADIICIYGMSFGETDKYWWHIIGDRLIKSNAILVIFNVDEVIPSRRSYAQIDNKDVIIEKFLSHLDIEETVKLNISKRIFVCLNSRMFKVKLDYAEQPDVLNVVKKFLEVEKENLKTS